MKIRFYRNVSKFLPDHRAPYASRQRSQQVFLFLFGNEGLNVMICVRFSRQFVDVSKPRSRSIKFRTPQLWRRVTARNSIIVGAGQPFIPHPPRLCKLSKSTQPRHFNERIICSDNYKTPDFVHTVYEHIGLWVHLWAVYLTTVLYTESSDWMTMTNEM